MGKKKSRGKQRLFIPPPHHLSYSHQYFPRYNFTFNGTIKRQLGSTLLHCSDRSIDHRCLTLNLWGYESWPKECWIIFQTKIRKRLPLLVLKKTNCLGSLKALKGPHTGLWEILILEDVLMTPNLEMIRVLNTFHTLLPRYIWHTLLYLPCMDWLRNTMTATRNIHTITCYSTEIIGALALISINKIIVLYTDSSILARVWLAFIFFYILYHWNSRLGRFFNAATRYISTNAVIFWEKPKEKKVCEVSVCNILVHFLLEIVQKHA